MTKVLIFQCLEEYFEYLSHPESGGIWFVLLLRFKFHESQNILWRNENEIVKSFVLLLQNMSIKRKKEDHIR